MNIKQAKEEIKNTVKAYFMKDEHGNYLIPAVRQRPMLLIGPPGVGKTQIMEQIARECKIGLVAYTITHHTRQSAVGLPFIREEEYDGKLHSVTEYTMSEIIASIYQKEKETGLKEGILFIDEINCVSETLAPTMLQFLQCKTFGNQAIPEGWMIVAAGNPPEYNKSVREFDMVTLDRVRCMNIEADLRVWKEYAKIQHINQMILSYLDLKPNNFYRVEADVDGLQFVTARGWEDLSNLIDAYEKLNLPVTEEVIYEFLRHHDVSEDAAAYFDLYKKYQEDYGITDILQGKVKPSVFAKVYQAAFDERVSVVNLLLDGLTNVLQEVKKEQYLTNQWYEFLKEYHENLVEKEDKKQAYFLLFEEKQQQFFVKKQSGLLTKEEQNWTQTLFGFIKQAADFTKMSEAEQTESNVTSTLEEKKEVAKKYFQFIKTGFDKQRETLENKEKLAENALENAFLFMEQAFENGQEMVIFVTELTVTPEAAMFLAEHPNEKYERYNRELLIGTKRADILAEIRQDEKK